MDFNGFKQIVIEKCAALGIEEYELYYQSGASTSVSAFQHEINQFTGTTEGGVCFRCIAGGKMGYASTEALTAQQAELIVEKAADNASVLEAEEQVFLCQGGQEYVPLEERAYEMPTTEELVSTVLATQEKLYAADSAVIDGCQTQGVAESSEIAIYNSKGLDLHSKTNLSGLVVVAVVSDGQEMANDFQIKLGKLDAIDADKLTAEAVKCAKGKLGGEVAPTGQYPVVFSPEAMSDLLDTYAGIFSSRAAQKGLSKLAGKEGEMIASSIVTLVDDPFHPQAPMPRNFDAEGSPAYKKNLIENGVFQTLLYNLKTAAVDGRKTTGNAYKSDYASAVGISPFTMYLAAGDMTEEQLLIKAGNGVYINSLGGLHAGANTVSGDFSLQSAGFMIEDGRKTRAVKSFTVAGNFYEVLKNITAVASNLELPGMARFGSPSVLVEGLSIAGK
ncbi:MAG: TldD/PmbA family protein [Oscillospiraceae bacterium]|nr:TldD/PmbA family protein [Oscillospiraceae bacterium]